VNATSDENNKSVNSKEDFDEVKNDLCIYEIRYSLENQLFINLCNQLESNDFNHQKAIKSEKNTRSSLTETFRASQSIMSFISLVTM